MTGFTQDDAGVDVELSDGTTLRASISSGVTGDGASIRKGAGIEFPGWDATRSNLIAEVEVIEDPPLGIRNDAAGVHRVQQVGGWRRWASSRPSSESGTAANPPCSDLSAALIARYGRDFGVHSPVWISRFTDMTRQAARYRAGRVLLAGDCGARALPGGGTGPRSRCAGRDESGLEAGAGGQRNIPGDAPGHVSGRAPPGCSAPASAHDGADRAAAPATNA